MAAPLTFIVPTRERHDTLRWSLKTLVTQDCDDLQILVSDNASSDATREVVESYDDPRIRYVNPGRRLAMHDHWEFAISHVDDGHFGILGDDDGVMPGAAAEIIAIILDAASTEALIWPVYSYYWPGYVDASIANSLSMRVDQPAAVDRVDARSTLALVAAFREHPHRLPSPYWGVVSRGVTRRASDAHGRFLHSMTPDIYAGIAVAAVADRYFSTGRAMTLSGESRHSNAAAQITGAGENSPTSASSVFLNENAGRFHPDLDYASNIDVLMAEALLQARDHILGVNLPALDVAALVSSALRHPDHLFNPRVKAGVEEAVRRTAERHGIAAMADRELARSHRLATPRLLAAGVRNLALGSPLFDCRAAGTSNIYEATLAAAALRDGSHSRSRELAGRATKARRAWDSLRGRFATK